MSFYTRVPGLVGDIRPTTSIDRLIADSVGYRCRTILMHHANLRFFVMEDKIKALKTKVWQDVHHLRAERSRGVIIKIGVTLLDRSSWVLALAAGIRGQER